MRNLFIFILGLLPFIAYADNPQVDTRRNASIDESVLKLQDTDDYIGNKNSKVTIVEYSSLNCPHCKQFHTDIFKLLKKDYIDTHKILFIYRDFPTNKAALSGSRLAHCKGKTVFFNMLSALFEAQEMWAFTDNYQNALLNIAKLSGITDDEFQKCQKDKAMEDFLVSRAMEGSNKLKIDATPTIFVNDEKIVGAKPYDYFKHLIDTKLGEKSN